LVPTKRLSGFAQIGTQQEKNSTPNQRQDWVYTNSGKRNPAKQDKQFGVGKKHGRSEGDTLIRREEKEGKKFPNREGEATRGTAETIDLRLWPKAKNKNRGKEG